MPRNVIFRHIRNKKKTAIIGTLAAFKSEDGRVAIGSAKCCYRKDGKKVDIFSKKDGRELATTRAKLKLESDRPCDGSDNSLMSYIESFKGRAARYFKVNNVEIVI